MKVDILLFTENCGSSWLIDLIGLAENVAHVDFEPLYSIMNLGYGYEHIGEYLNYLHPTFDLDGLINYRKMLKMDDFNQYQIDKIKRSNYFIFKFRSNEMPYVKKLSLIQSGSRLIHLKRNDELKQIVSIYKRRVYKIDHFNNFLITPSIFIKKEIFLQIASELKILKDKNDQFFDDWKGQKICIYYEKFLDHLKTNLNCLGCEMNYTINLYEGFYKKITHDDLSLAVSNYEDLMIWYEDFLYN